MPHLILHLYVIVIHKEHIYFATVCHDSPISLVVRYIENLRNIFRQAIKKKTEGRMK